MPIYDGHINLFGVNNTAGYGSFHRNPSMDIVGSAINRTHRGAESRTRPPIWEMEMTFENKEDEEVFRDGAISGVWGYHATKKNAYPSIIVAVHDRLLWGRVYGRQIGFTRLYKGLTPGLMHSAAIQCVDRLYFQNGLDRPIGWDGVAPAYVIPAGDDSMPLFTLMSFCQGRMVGCTEDNYVIISDHIYGNGLKDTRGVESWIEYQANNDLGAIASPFPMGPVMALSVSRSIDQLNAQGEQIVWGTNGAYSLNISGPRDEWLFGGIQKISLAGRGAASPYGVVPANNDTWYQCSDGTISSYKFERTETANEWGDTSLSTEVSDYLAKTDPSRLQYVAGITAHNRLLMTCGIQFSAAKLGGVNRFGLGMVVLDFDKGSTLNKTPGFCWDGLWTGPAVIQFAQIDVDGARRTFAVSHDDGRNRIFEFMNREGNDRVSGKEKKIVSFYDTPYYFQQQQVSDLPVLKKLSGVHVLPSKINNAGKMAVHYSPDFSNLWFETMHELPVGSDEIPNWAPTGKPVSYADQSYLVTSETPDRNEKLETVCQNAYTAYHFRLRIQMEGDVSIAQVQACAEPMADSSKSTCATGKEPKTIALNSPSIFQYRF